MRNKFYKVQEQLNNLHWIHRAYFRKKEDAEILKMKCQMFCMIVHCSNKVTQNFFSVSIYKVTKIEGYIPYSPS